MVTCQVTQRTLNHQWTFNIHWCVWLEYHDRTVAATGPTTLNHGHLSPQTARLPVATCKFRVVHSKGNIPLHSSILGLKFCSEIQCEGWDPKWKSESNCCGWGGKLLLGDANELSQWHTTTTVTGLGKPLSNFQRGRLFKNYRIRYKLGIQNHSWFGAVERFVNPVQRN